MSNSHPCLVLDFSRYIITMENTQANELWVVKSLATFVCVRLILSQSLPLDIPLSLF